MIRHIFLLSFRNFKRQKQSFFINLVGLSTGLTCALLILLWVQDELKFDQFHENDDRLYQVMEHQQYAEEIMTTTSTPGILAETMADEFAEIEYAATTTWINPNTLSVGDHHIKAEGWHVGSDFFNIFSYPLLVGHPDQVLKDVSSILLSRSTAKRLLNMIPEAAIGKTIEFQHEKSFIITGIFEDIPRNSRYKFDYVQSFEVFKDDNEWVRQWGNNGPSTYITLQDHVNPENFSRKIEDYIKSKDEDSNVTLFIHKYSDRYLRGRYENGVQSGGRIEYVRLFSLIAIFILIIACINFMNLSTARAAYRSKEIAIKKAVGAPRSSIILQYLSESIVISIISLLIAIGLVWFLLPGFNRITDKSIILIFTPMLVITLMGIAMITGLVAGSYPALYTSRFTPVKVFQGALKGSFWELWARRGLVVFQFALSIILIVSVFVIYKQVLFVQTKNLGYNKDQVITFPIEGALENNTATFIHELKQISGVKNASSIGHTLLGRNSNTSGLNWTGKDPNSRILFENVRVNYDLIETMDIPLKLGRSFSREFGTDTSKIILNETAVHIMDLQNPLGETIRLWDEYDLEVIGVVEDFHFQSLHEPVNPLFMWLTPEETWFMMVRIDDLQEKMTLHRIRSFYEQFNPGFTFDFEFMDEEYASLYKSEQRVSTLSKYFAGMAILISCLGLFGLAVYTTERRVKEIGIRKVLGSSSFGIVTLLTANFSKMVIAAILIAIPISYFLVQNWLSRFTYKINLSWWLFFLAAFLSLIIAWLTVSIQAFKAANVNPAQCLRE